MRAETTTRIAGRLPQPADVVELDPTGVLVAVRLHTNGEPDRNFQVRLDRAAALAEVQRIETLPASVLGDLGLSEVFPAAAGAPPDRPLRPGAGWTVDQPVRLPDTAAARLSGHGRLARLGVVGGRQVATIESNYSLAVHQTATGSVIDGEERTSVSAAHALRDGAIQSVHAVTSGHFTLTLPPPAGVQSPPLVGSLDVEITSTTHRIG